MTRIVITGGAAGLGRAMAENYLAEGAQVAVCDVDADAVMEMAGAHPGAIVRQADVTDEAEMHRFLGEVEAEWGGADVLVASAGIGGPAGPLETLDYGAWQACLSVSLDGSFLACRWAARVMRAKGAGLIVLMASSAGLFGYPGRAPYAAAKWGIVGLTKTLAMELGPAGVRVNAIAPGAVEGDRMERVLTAEAAAKGRPVEDVRQDYVAGVSLRTWVRAEDIVGALRYLDSPAGARVSGQVLSVDGHTETLAP